MNCQKFSLLILINFLATRSRLTYPNSIARTLTSDDEQSESDPDEQIKLLSFGVNESYCIGEEVTVSWESFPEARVMALNLSKPGRRYSVAYVPASYNEENLQDGSGSYVWQAGQIADESFVDEGLVYTLEIITQTPDGTTVSDSSKGLISLKDCRG